MSDNPTVLLDCIEAEFDLLEAPRRVECTGCGWEDVTAGALGATILALAHERLHEAAEAAPVVSIYRVYPDVFYHSPRGSS